MKTLLIVDGYNIIHAWPELKAVFTRDREHARERLVELLAEYAGAKGVEVFIVFDAIYTPGEMTTRQIGTFCTVIFTSCGETADSYIERTVYEKLNTDDNIYPLPSIYVATSDGPEQAQILGAGAYRLSARELREKVQRTHREQRYTEARMQQGCGHTDIGASVRNAEVREKLEKMRRSK